MNIPGKINLPIMMIVPLNILSMEVKQTSLSSDSVQANNKNDVMPKGFPVEVKIKILKDMINSAQTVQECDNLFKVLVEINKDLPTKKNDNYKQRFFRSALFNEIELKKYKILCDIDHKLKKHGFKNWNVIRTGVNGQDKSQYTALHYAAQFGLLEIVDVLVKNGAMINVQNKFGLTPLHFAACNGREAVVELLIKSGADVNVFNADQETPLHFAAEIGHLAIVELLIKNGANTAMSNYENKTPLDLAQENGHQAIVELLKAAQSNGK